MQTFHLSWFGDPQLELFGITFNTNIYHDCYKVKYNQNIYFTTLYYGKVVAFLQQKHFL